MPDLGRCIKCRRPLIKGKYAIVPADFASWIAGEQVCPEQKAGICNTCSEPYKEKSHTRKVVITTAEPLIHLAKYNPSTGTINPLPLLAVYMDHDICNDAQILANVALTHEFIHYWLHRNMSHLVCVQFDNVAFRFNNWLYEILDENFPDIRPDKHYWVA